MAILNNISAGGGGAYDSKISSAFDCSVAYSNCPGGSYGTMIPCGDGFFTIDATGHSTGDITQTAPSAWQALAQINMGMGPIEGVNQESQEEKCGSPPQPAIGSVVWSKATGNGPYVVVGETIAEVEEHKSSNYKKMHRIEAMLVRDTSGRFRTIPAADLTTVKPYKPSSYSRFLLAASLSVLAIGVAAILTLFVVGLIISSLR